MNTKYMILCLADGARYPMTNAEGAYQKIEDAIAASGYIDLPMNGMTIRVFAQHVTQIIFSDVEPPAGI